MLRNCSKPSNHKTSKALCCSRVPFFIVEKSVVMVYNELLNFTGVTDGYDKPGFDVVKAVKAFMKKLNTFLNF